MFNRDEEHVITAVAALLAKVDPARRAAIASEVLQRLSGTSPLANRDAPTTPVARRVPAPKPPRKE